MPSSALFPQTRPRPLLLLPRIRCCYSPIIVPLLLVLLILLAPPQPPMRLSLHNGPLNIGISTTAAAAAPAATSSPDRRPHIVIILADDLGFDDVSFRGSDQIPTPNIDSLAYQGQILNRHYVAPMCTPSRAALLTGRYPLRTGMQHHVISNAEPWGLPLTERLLPEYLRQQGYSTNLVGKWHLGFAWDAMTPTNRGFDHFRGYLGAYIDYYRHHANVSGWSGYDLRLNAAVDEENRGKYATDMFTEYAINVIDRHDAQRPLFLLVNHLAPHTGNDDDPMQAPEEDVARFSYIKDPKRRIYAAMVAKLDDSVGAIVEALRRRDLLRDSVILFSADNGAPSVGGQSNAGSNYPLRGQKDTPWEGGIRAAAAVWSPFLEERHLNNDKLIYVGDWLPTFLNLAGLPQQQMPRNIDGVDQWNVLRRPSARTPSARQEILHNIDPVDRYVSYLRADGFKYVEYGPEKLDGWYGGGERDSHRLPAEEYVALVKASKTWSALNEYATKNLTREDIMALRSAEPCPPSDLPEVRCDASTSPCLFDVFEDACERRNLAASHPGIMRELRQKVDEWRLKAVPINNKPRDECANPALHGDVWVSWKDQGNCVEN